ncbi:DNA methyltransferase [Tenacibaculum sp. Bg11-29]|uniref:DNA methyltransferase n=1 Tax=Tenacibaculum sp. Bg11-29 TaxID=2058306 RepID=UPI000C3371B1|nr:DNA methyltransferase [Tenacibaculum sp. Bg11-29]PKH50858.1 DNA methyltransferase [Tenacibaculum sp. Bg11-29]
MSKNFANAPLPFQGQKRGFIKQFKEVLKTYPKDAIYVDLFGGSGLLSHTVKKENPKAKVIYNDYDNFKQRLNAIPMTNKLLCDLRVLVEGVLRDQIIPEDIKAKILAVVAKADKAGFVDYISLSSNLLFSMVYVDSLEALKKPKFYNNVRKSNYDATGYLQDVEFVKYDYKELFNNFQQVKNVVFLVDPPYLSTDCSTYNNYWKLADYLDVLKVLKDTNYIYFTSNKSSVIELCEWIETNTGGKNPFNKAKVVYRNNVATYKSSYTDIMLHKRYKTTTT